MVDNLGELEAKRVCNDHIHEHTKGIVLSGPFKGMRLAREEVWPDGNHGTRLLGCYEQELHRDIEAEIERLTHVKSPVVLNIGCAEGYYAVGMAMRLPNARVHVIDKEPRCFDILERNAASNDVPVYGTPDVAASMLLADLIICDCEGAELDYLDLAKHPTLEFTTMIVECHDCNVPQCTERLRTRFAKTHEISVIFEAGRNPNLYSFLWGNSSIERWLAVSEGRPSLMNWLVMRPNQPQGLR